MPSEADDRRVFYLYTVSMCNGEFDHSGIMDRIAKKVADEHPDQEVIVTVNEHGGWFLQYVRHPDKPGEMMVIGTANDTAQWRDAKISVREAIAKSSFAQGDFPSYYQRTEQDKQDMIAALDLLTYSAGKLPI